MIEQWLQQVVDSFWQAAGEHEPFPRHLERPVLWALPLAIVKLPRLWLCDVKAWLAQRDIPFHLDGQNRQLHGCTIAYAGRGFILLDGSDPDDEYRFSLAHEISHFLVDYLLPRQHAIRRLGTGIAAVLDGLRPATVDERVAAILRSMPIGVHAHLMDRRPDGSLGCSRIVEAENRADRLALELLAPATEVRWRIEEDATTLGFQEGVKRTIGLLMHDFGLPQTVADAYGRALYTHWYGGLSIRDWLRF